MCVCVRPVCVLLAISRKKRKKNRSTWCVVSHFAFSHFSFSSSIHLLIVEHLLTSQSVWIPYCGVAWLKIRIMCSQLSKIHVVGQS